MDNPRCVAPVATKVVTITTPDASNYHKVIDRGRGLYGLANSAITASGNGLSPDRHQAIIRPSAG